MWHPPANHPLRRLFAGLTEHAFIESVGVADPPLVDYVAELLLRFLNVGAVHKFGDADGRPLTEVADMVMEAEAIPPEGRTYREVHRHIGDVTLFWTGLFPDGVRRKRTGWAKDCFVGYATCGKRSYRIASSFESDPYREEAAVLRRLSDEFELCAFGLNKVREELDSLKGDVVGGVIG